MTTLSPWATVVAPRDASRFPELGPGEREALALAKEKEADFVLMDETLGRKTAVNDGIAVKGTLGVLEDAARQGLVKLLAAIERLKTTGIFLGNDVIK